MKLKAILVLTIISLTTFCHGQSYNKWNNESGKRYRTFTSYFNGALDMPVTYTKEREYIKERGIDTVTLKSVRVNKRGKEKPRMSPVRYILDTAGRVSVAEKMDDKTGDIKWYNELYYDEKGRQSEVRTLDENRTVTERQVYVARAVFTEERAFYVIDEKGDTTRKTVIGAIDTVSYSSTDKYYEKGKLKYTWKNEYYPNKSRKRCTFYKKGKEKYVWDYQCKEEGVEIKKHKDTSTICVSKEWDTDSVLTRVYHNVSEKGVLTKTVVKTNTSYQRLYYKETIGSDDRVVMEEINKFAEDGLTLLASDIKRYGTKHVRNRRVKTYDQDGNEISDTQMYYDKKGVKTSEYTISYTFDSLNRPLQRLATDSKRGVEDKIYYVYE